MTYVKTRIILGVIAAGLLGDHAVALAQSTTEPVVTERDDKPWSRGTSIENRQAARGLFLEGNRLFRVPLFARAAEQYTAALAKWKHPAFYFNLAVAQVNLGLDVEARENLTLALKYGEEPLGAAEFREAQRVLAELERQLGQIRVACQTPGAIVTLDGVTLFTGPGSYQGWTRAKTHELTARKQDYLSETRQVTVVSGKIESIELKLVTLSEASDANRRWATWKPWVVLAAGGAIAAGGGALHFLSSRNFNSYDEGILRLSCANPDGQSPGCKSGQVPGELSDKLSRARLEQKLAVGGYIAGGALVATGIVLVILNRPRLTEQRPASSRVTVAPALAPDLVGIQVRVGL